MLYYYFFYPDLAREQSLRVGMYGCPSVGQHIPQDYGRFQTARFSWKCTIFIAIIPKL